MRVSEMLGLEWCNVNLDEGSIVIEQQTGRVYGEPGVCPCKLKTYSSLRTVRVPKCVCTILRRHQDTQRFDARRGQKETAVQTDFRVFVSQSGKWYYRSQFEADFRRVTGELGIAGATPHTMRHTASSLVQESGASIKTAQALLGHVTLKMTLLYSQSTPQGSLQVSTIMGEHFGSVASAQLHEDLTKEDSPFNTDEGRTGPQTVIETG